MQITVLIVNTCVRAGVRACACIIGQALNLVITACYISVYTVWWGKNCSNCIQICTFMDINNLVCPNE